MARGPVPPTQAAPVWRCGAASTALPARRPLVQHAHGLETMQGSHRAVGTEQTEGRERGRQRLC